MRSRPQHESNGAAFPWLFKAATREAVKLGRRTRRWAELEQLAEAAVGSSRHTTQLADRDRFVARAVNGAGQRLDGRLELLAALQTMAAAGLRHRERQTLILRAMGYSRGEMAAMTGESCRTVDRQRARARRKLPRSGGRVGRARGRFLMCQEAPTATARRSPWSRRREGRSTCRTRRCVAFPGNGRRTFWFARRAGKQDWVQAETPHEAIRKATLLPPKKVAAWLDQTAADARKQLEHADLAGSGADPGGVG